MIEHVGSTSIPGLAAKPIIDIDVVVDGDEMSAAVAAMRTMGYMHRGDLGVTDREAFRAPDDEPRRNVYVCRRDSLSVRIIWLSGRPGRRADLRDEYGAVKLALAADHGMDVETYIARKSTVLQKVLAVSQLTADERLQILRLNDPSA